jgi:hypothetical protein
MAPHPLNYMPARHARRAPVWLTSGVPAAVLAVLFAAALIWVHGWMSIPLQAFLAMGAAVFGAAAAYSFLAGPQAWEYRLDDQVLEFRRPFDRGWATVPLDQLRRVWQVRQSEGNWHYELAFRTGAGLRLEKQALGDFVDFQQKLCELRPGIRFGNRWVNECPECGGDFHEGNVERAARIEWFSHRCDRCGARLPRHLKPIPPGGVVLPEALER